MVGSRTEKTRVYVAFLRGDSPGLFSSPPGFDAYRRMHADAPVMTNDDILARLRDECARVELVGTGEPLTAEEAIREVHRQKADLEGLLVFAAPHHEIPDALLQPLPTIAVEPLLGWCPTVPFHAFKGRKVLTSCLPVRYRDKDPQVYARRIADITGKLRLIDAVSRMRRLRVLVVTDLPPLGYFEPMNEQLDSTRHAYEQVYVENLREVFGAELVAVPQQRLFEKVASASEADAQEIAEEWIRGAVALRGSNESEVLKSAKLYLAMKDLMNETGCQAITTEGFGWPPLGYDEANTKGIASQGLSTSQLLTDGIAAASETLVDCLLTQQLGLWITGSAGLLGDYSIDFATDTAILAHCEGTFRPYADDRRTPYTIRNLPMVEENTGGACAQPHYPIGETVTVAKLSMYRKRLSLFSGETVSGEDLFPYWADILGRSKVAVRTDAKALLENVDWETYGNHRVVLFGDHRQQLKEMAKLIGFEVFEKDRLWRD